MRSLFHSQSSVWSELITRDSFRLKIRKSTENKYKMSLRETLAKRACSRY
jgi:hypothetical protein